MISKKEFFKDEMINDKLLNSSNAPTLISKEAVKFEINNFLIYIYPYNHVDDEINGYSYYCDDNKFLLCNGLVNVNGSLRNPDIIKFFKDLELSELIGHYQLISIDKTGNGFVKTPSISTKQLFLYEDENCSILATEINLIVDGVQKFREKTFANHYDPDFIKDVLFNEWGGRKYPRHSIFKEIKRVFPHDIKYFENGKIIIERKESIDVPKKFINAFNNDKDHLYDDYIKFVMNFTEINLANLKLNIDKIILGLTGGFDSRLAAVVLSIVCKKLQIPLIFYTSGQDTHPDVIIAKKVAEALDIEHFHHDLPDNGFPNSNTYDDYALTFYLGHGDWNSKDFVSYFERKISSRVSPLTDDLITTHAPGIYPVNESEVFQQGMVAYRRTKIDSVIRDSIWTARRVHYYQNFTIPLFFTDCELWFGLLYGEVVADNGKDDAYKEFVYEVLKRIEPRLLDIPFAGDSLPQVKVKPYLRIEDSKHHDREPFLWDYEYVKENLKPILTKNLDELDHTEKSFLKLAGLNELDYFFNKKISEIIKSYQEKKIDLEECFRRLLRERSPKNYPHSKSMMKRTKKSDKYINKMQILMDFASVANKKSFQEIEKDIGV
ncbi:hypothetical protein [Methanobacterium sp. SMA-27]|uniref:hypothetical protein n=1 Tax=Methanobacterium sp. SMA-27 TaxID=1495336 RepID=UPI0012E08C70|nr:hypothetical protein [Methanobacterium sp. SMA-27]